MKNLNDGPRDASTYDLFGCSEKELDRHIRDVLREADPDGMTMHEVSQQVICRATKQLA